MNITPKNCWYRSVCPNVDTFHCSYACSKFTSMNFLVQNSGLPEKLKVANKMTVPPKDRDAYLRLNEIKSNIEDFVAKGSNLYLYSDMPGNGKTTWASRLLMAYFSVLSVSHVTSPRGRFVSVTEFLQMGTQYWQAEAFSSLYKQVCNASLVVFDDIGVFEPTAQESKLLYIVVNSRISNGLSNIFTSNRSNQNLADTIGEHLTSRIWNTSETIKFVSRDVRNAF